MACSTNYICYVVPNFTLTFIVFQNDGFEDLKSLLLFLKLNNVASCKPCADLTMLWSFVIMNR